MSDSNGKKPDGDRVSDDELDLVATDRLVAALGRRFHSLVVAGLVCDDARRYQTLVHLLPNAVACDGLVQLIGTAQEQHMRMNRRRVAGIIHAGSDAEGRE